MWARDGELASRHGRKRRAAALHRVHRVGEDGESDCGITSTTRHDGSCDYDRDCPAFPTLSTRPMIGMSKLMMTLEITRSLALRQGTRQELSVHERRHVSAP